MKALFPLLTLTLLPATAAFALPNESPAEAKATPVKIEYLEPEKFTDVRERMGRTSPEKNQHLKYLKSYLEKAAGKRLQPGQSLLIQFTDIDLAGDIEPTTRPGMIDVRIVKDMYPPRMKFRYEWKDGDGKLLKAGEEKLQDMAFMMHAKSAASSNYYYEEEMLDDWLGELFTANE